MDCTQYITVAAERKKGQHLGREERGAIQYLKRHGLSNRAIARELGCSPTTVGNELRRGTPPRKSNKGRPPGYSAKRGEAVYKANRVRSKRNHKILSCTCFLNWTTTQVRVHKWSLDACVGYARLHGLFAPEEMVCTHTLYNEVWAGKLSLTATELPEALKRKQHKASLARENKKNYGNGISERPEIAALRIEEGHWEGDTVVGKRAGKEAVVLSLLEKKTENYIAMRIPGKDSASVLDAMRSSKRSTATASARYSRPLPWTTAPSSPALLRLRAGAAKYSSLTRTPLGSVPRTNVSTACSVPLFPRVHPLRTTPQRTSCMLLTN